MCLYVDDLYCLVISNDALSVNHWRYICSIKIYDVFRGSHFCLLAFSTTDRESFENVRWWKKKVENECGLVPMVLVMNKIDLIANSVIER